MVIINQKVNRILYIICIATAVFCRTPPSESTKTATEKEEKKKAGIRMMILIVFIILCALVFICKKFSKSSRQEIEVVSRVSSERSSEPAVIPLNTPFEDKDYKKRSLQCNVKLYDHQTSACSNSMWEETSAINAKPLTPTMLELDTNSLQPQQAEQQLPQITKPSNEVLNSRMSRTPIAATTLELKTRSLQPQQAEQHPYSVTQPLSSSSPSVASIYGGVMTRPTITVEQDASSLQPLEDEQRKTRAIETIRTKPRSIEALNSRITRKQLLGKTMDIMKIGCTSKQISRISVHVV